MNAPFNSNTQPLSPEEIVRRARHVAATMAVDEEAGLEELRQLVHDIEPSGELGHVLGPLRVLAIFKPENHRFRRLGDEIRERHEIFGESIAEAHVFVAKREGMFPDDDDDEDSPKSKAFERLYRCANGNDKTVEAIRRNDLPRNSITGETPEDTPYRLPTNTEKDRT